MDVTLKHKVKCASQILGGVPQKRELRIYVHVTLCMRKLITDVRVELCSYVRNIKSKSEV
jgi:hypothetical protein